MKKGKSESMDTLQGCCLEFGGLASANLTDKQETYPGGRLEGSGGERKSVQLTG